MLAANLPAIVIGLLVFGKIENGIEKRYPGIDNRNMRTTESGKSLLAFLITYGAILWFILSLAEGLFCISS